MVSRRMRRARNIDELFPCALRGESAIMFQLRQDSPCQLVPIVLANMRFFALLWATIEEAKNTLES